MWKSYFGEGSKIVGIDINPECKKHEAPGIEIVIGSQDDAEILQYVFDKYLQVDIILDDGSHVMDHMVRTFGYAYSRLSAHGVYMADDTHTCYWEEYGGGVKRPGSFMELVKDKLDEINAVHTRGVIPISAFTRSTDSICCYDSVVVFEKRLQGKRQAPVTNAMG